MAPIFVSHQNGISVTNLAHGPYILENLCIPGLKICRLPKISSRWRSWLRHCATSRKVTGSILDGVIEIFHWHNPPGRTMTLGLTQLLTEMSTRYSSWGWRRPVNRADNLTTFMCQFSWNLGASTSSKTQGMYRPLMWLFYLYLKFRVKLWIETYFVQLWTIKYDKPFRNISEESQTGLFYISCNLLLFRFILEMLRLAG